MNLVFIIIMTIMLYVVLENNKIKMIFDRIHMIDLELEKELKQFILNCEDINVFTINEMRDLVNKKFLIKHKIDDFKIYKESAYKIRVMLRLGLAVQKLEMLTNGAPTRLEEISLEYSNIDFSKK